MNYANEQGWSETYPFEVIKVVSPITLIIRAMRTERDPDWQPVFSAGGFAAHCHNQHEQKWLYFSEPTGEVLRIRKSKLGHWANNGRKFHLSDEPRYYYDYNF